MKILKLAREKQGLTQTELAKHIGTTQQTIARWEAGKTEPSHAALRDLAICLSTTVDKLLGRKSVLEHQTTNPLAWISGDKSGYWGNIGIRLPQNKFSMWYPITTSTMETIYRALQDVEEDTWIAFQTLNNKMVICRPSQVQSFMFLDEADDDVEGDWNVGPDDVEGWPQEIYECLEHLMWDELGAADEEGQFSERLIAVARELISEHKLDADRLMAMCVQTRIVCTGGTVRLLHVSDKRLADAMFQFDLGMEYVGSEMLHLDDGDGDRQVFWSLDFISLMEFPLLALKEGMKKQIVEDTGIDPDKTAVEEETPKPGGKPRGNKRKT